MSASPRSRRTESGLKSAPAAGDAGAPPRGARVRASLPLPPDRGRVAVIVSTALHLLLIFALLRITVESRPPRRSPIGDAFQLAIGGGGGGGKGGASFAAVPPPAPATTAAVPQPVPAPLPQIVPPLASVLPPVGRDTAPAASTAAASGSGGGSGGGTGTGTGTGSGSGAGPGSGGGTGGGTGGGARVGTPPDNRQMMIPPIDPPKSLKGKTVEVTFYVDALGKVTDVIVKPPIEDRGFARKFDEAIRRFGFRPARDTLGVAIAGSRVFTISF